MGLFKRDSLEIAVLAFKKSDSWAVGLDYKVLTPDADQEWVALEVEYLTDTVDSQARNLPDGLSAAVIRFTPGTDAEGSPDMDVRVVGAEQVPALDWHQHIKQPASAS